MYFILQQTMPHHVQSISEARRIQTRPQLTREVEPEPTFLTDVLVLSQFERVKSSEKLLTGGAVKPVEAGAH